MFRYFNILIGDYTQIIIIYVLEIRSAVFLKAFKYNIYSIVRQQSVHQYRRKRTAFNNVH